MTALAATTGYQFTVVRQYEAIDAAHAHLLDEWQSKSDMWRNSARYWLPTAQAEIHDIGVRCARDNWDGPGSGAVTPATLGVAAKVARALFLMLPLGIPAPDIGPDPDGEVSFDWIADQGRMFSLSVGENGNASYAGRFGDDGSMHGWSRTHLGMRSTRFP